MRLVPQPAMIVTANDINDNQSPWRGATVSSFTTVTFKPDVIVSLNLKLPSATFDGIRASNCFHVNALRPNDIAAETADQFAKRHAISQSRETGNNASVMPNQTPKQFHQADPRLLHQGHGVEHPVAFSIKCLYMPEKSVQLGDHIVIFGIVKDIPKKSYNHFMEEGKPCLAYVDGCYGRVKPLSNQPQEQSEEPSLRKHDSVLNTTLCTIVNIKAAILGACKPCSGTHSMLPRKFSL